MNKKEITIKGEKFYYIVLVDSDLYGVYYSTEFFQETKIVKYKKYWLFGEIITKEEPIILFEVNINIESDKYTKEQTRAKIESAFNLSKRKEEILRGEII